MDAVRQWAFSVCAAMVACGLARMILPRSNLQKVFSLTVSVFFLCALLSPLAVRSPEIRLQITEYSQEDIARRAENLTRIVEYQSETAAVYNVEKIILQKLSEMGINHRSIAINISTNGQNTTSVDSVDIVLEQQHEREHQYILGELKKAFDLTIRLGYE